MQNMNTNDLLVELGTEDLPAKGLNTLSQAFAECISACLNKAELTFTNLKSYVTPRRLAVVITDLSAYQADRIVIKRGPAKNLAYDNEGKPTEILLRFAQSCHVSPEQLTLQETTKGAWVVFEYKETGKSAELLLPEIIQQAINTLPLAKRMRWDSLEQSFIRPVHWVVLLFGNKNIPAEYFGISSHNKTHGHRFHCPTPLEVSQPQDYENLLYKPGCVIADFQKRKADIQSQMMKIAAQQAATPLLDETLLEEVTGLIEWPVVLLGKISADFLALPQEVLITSMQTHQKCFAVTNKTNELLPYFLIISNIASTDPQCVVQGNECVMHARLSDAAFYYKIDQEKSLADRRENLKQVIFQQGLGSLWDKCQRIAQLANIIAPLIGAKTEYTQRASELCKTDLLTYMVGEFPELQGIMARYYALHDREPEAVAKAIEQHYYPRFSQDELPSTKEGTALALADRIDTLVGLFGIGKRPTGDKDPYGLRRQAFGCLRIMIEQALELDLLQLLNQSAKFYGTLLTSHDFLPELMNFCFDRLRAWSTDQQISARVFESVFERLPTSPYNFNCRLLAVSHFLMLPEAESLAQANKRVKNILAKTVVPPGDVDVSLLSQNEEKALLAAIIDKEVEIAPLMQKNLYEAALNSLAALKIPVDSFFEQVMVMADDETLRENRLKLLNRLRALFLKIADISVL